MIAVSRYYPECREARGGLPYGDKTVGARKIEIHLHFPPKWKPEDKRPVMVFFFGGGWTSGSPDQFLTQADYFAARGIVTARADYRVKSRDGVTPDKCVEDARSAVRWLRKNAARLGVDPEKLIVSGGSAGGHLAACTMIRKSVEDPGDDLNIPTVPQAMVLYNPALCGSDADAKRVGCNKELLKKIAPLDYVDKNTPPSLVLFGTKDKLKAGGDKFCKLAAAVKVRAEMFTAEGAGHGFFGRSPWLEKTTAAAHEFLASLGYVKADPKKDLEKKPAGPGAE